MSGGNTSSEGILYPCEATRVLYFIELDHLYMNFSFALRSSNSSESCIISSGRDALLVEALSVKFVPFVKRNKLK